MINKNEVLAAASIVESAIGGFIVSYPLPNGVEFVIGSGDTEESAKWNAWNMAPLWMGELRERLS